MSVEGYHKEERDNFQNHPVRCPALSTLCKGILVLDDSVPRHAGAFSVGTLIYRVVVCEDRRHALGGVAQMPRMSHVPQQCPSHSFARLDDATALWNMFSRSLESRYCNITLSVQVCRLSRTSGDRMPVAVIVRVVIDQ